MVLYWVAGLIHLVLEFNILWKKSFTVSLLYLSSVLLNLNTRYPLIYLKGSKLPIPIILVKHGWMASYLPMKNYPKGSPRQRLRQTQPLTGIITVQFKYWLLLKAKAITKKKEKLRFAWKRAMWSDVKKVQSTGTRLQKNMTSPILHFTGVPNLPLGQRF